MGRKIPGRIKKDLRARVKKAKKILFFLDYDGTLTPIRKRPELARVKRDVKNLLRTISRKRWAEVFIISGRALRDIKRLVGINSLSYSGNHGIEFEGPRLKYTNPAAKALRGEIQNSFRILKNKFNSKKIIVENKIYTLSIHYRLLAPANVPALKKAFKDATKELSKNKKIKITHGKKVIELRPNISWNKGSIVKYILKKRKIKKSLPIYIGDDITDEDAFRALGKKGISILVARNGRRTAARYKLDSPGAVARFLEFVMREREQ
ncbi:MAG: trehalose-phosphatase [Omnitrophica bacterium]|nr:trehalose-phosphatase [Candidatus Omnitrophota bacterium]